MLKKKPPPISGKRKMELEATSTEKATLKREV